MRYWYNFFACCACADRGGAKLIPVALCLIYSGLTIDISVEIKKPQLMIKLGLFELFFSLSTI